MPFAPHTDGLVIPGGQSGVTGMRSVLGESSENSKVLIIEDNECLALIIQLVLEREGYVVRTARDGRHGYHSYVVFRPHVVITDIEIPEINGIEMMRRIRMHNPKVRTIYMSGHPGRFRLLLEEEKRRYKVSLLKKPFCKVELLRLLSGD
ncbi:MAG: response regulator [Candidatus Binatia bacterium]